MSKILLKVVERTALGGFTLKSDFARLHAVTVAMAASRGLITTRHPLHLDRYGNTWLPTIAGLHLLERTST